MVPVIMADFLFPARMADFLFPARMADFRLALPMILLCLVPLASSSPFRLPTFRGSFRADLPAVRQAVVARRFLGEAEERQEWRHSTLLSRQRTGSCWSQREQHLYYKSASMSEAFESALEKYEDMHRRCTATVDWESLTQQWAEGRASDNDCKYLIYLPADRGLGNRLIALVSTFALGMLTNRAVLVPQDSFVGSHLCSPFKDSSWSLSTEHWERLLNSSVWDSRESIENMETLLQDSSSSVASLELDLTSIAHASAASFFCPQSHEQVLSKVPLLFLKTDVYLIPALHFIPQFDSLLQNWFPDGHAFLHLGRFLIHPVNKIWFRITRYYDAYLRHHSRIVGVQIRQYTSEDDVHVDERVLTCLRNVSGLLQDWRPEEEFLQSMKDTPQRSLVARQGRSIAVLVTSLEESHADAIFEFVTRNVPAGGEAVSILRLSHQHTETWEENQFESALEEIILLSMSDDLLVTDFSTFGYVAAGLSGLSPYSMNIVSYLGKDWWSNGRAECQRVSTEPCQHQMPAALTTLQCGSSSKSTTELHANVHQCDAINMGLQYQVAS